MSPRDFFWTLVGVFVLSFSVTAYIIFVIHPN